MSNNSEFNWAKAAFSVASSEASDLRELVAAAELDAEGGDLSDIDLSDMDLTDQDLSGWDLRNASFRNARLTRTGLHGAIIDPFQLVQAVDWKEAKLDERMRAAAENAEVLILPIDKLEIPIRPARVFEAAGILRIGDIVTKSEPELLMLSNFGGRSLDAVKKALVGHGLHLGMDIPSWPPANLPAPDLHWLWFKPG